MFKNKKKELFAGILAGAVLTFGIGNSLLSSHLYQADLFGTGEAVTTNSSSLYGSGKPDTKDELCSFLSVKLNSLKVLTPKALHRYTKDFDLHCSQQSADTTTTLRAAPEEIDWSDYPYQLKTQYIPGGVSSFLRNATSGIDSILRSSSRSIDDLFRNSTEN